MYRKKAYNGISYTPSEKKIIKHANQHLLNRVFLVPGERPYANKG